MSLRIVGAGVGRTGTSSLRVALEQLLGGPCYHMTEVMARRDDTAQWRDLVLDGVQPNWPTFFAGYRATLDWPAAAYWRDIADANPEALVLLSVRASADEWYDSFARTIVPVLTDERWFGEQHVEIEVSRLVVFNRFTRKIRSRRAAIRAYEAHNARVRALVPKERLVEWQPGDGWGPLCEALGVPEPSEAFPHVNTRDEFRTLAGIEHVEVVPALSIGALPKRARRFVRRALNRGRPIS